jgi:nitroimidazol reductase NimA-like FMN-containing flavoprotein (pyridoxamine 5'-phosphate oxidase superfamily)
MLVKELGRQECRDLLTRLGFGRLACARENRPYVVPIYFTFVSEPDRLYGFSTKGQKVEWMRLNPTVCVEVDEVSTHIDWASVVLMGRYEEFPDRPEYAARRQEAEAILEKRPMWWQTGFAAAQTRGKFDRDIPVLYCIHIEEITGRRAVPDPVEHSLDRR